MALTSMSEHRAGCGLTQIDHFASVARQGLGIDGNSLAGNADMLAPLRLAALTWSGGVRSEQAPGPCALLETAARGDAETSGLGAEI